MTDNYAVETFNSVFVPHGWCMTARDGLLR